LHPYRTFSRNKTLNNRGNSLNQTDLLKQIGRVPLQANRVEPEQ
jgi:hypothetical protein